MSSSIRSHVAERGWILGDSDIKERTCLPTKQYIQPPKTPGWTFWRDGEARGNVITAPLDSFCCYPVRLLDYFLRVGELMK